MKSKVKLESCCGSEAYLYILTAPVLKEHVKLFEDEGFRILGNFLKAGVIQGTKGKLTFTVTIGQTRLNCRCYNRCRPLINTLEKIISKIENNENSKDPHKLVKK